MDWNSILEWPHLFPLISMRAVSLVSSQRWLCLDTDAWCKGPIWLLAGLRWGNASVVATKTCLIRRTCFEWHWSWASLVKALMPLKRSMEVNTYERVTYLATSMFEASSPVIPLCVDAWIRNSSDRTKQSPQNPQIYGRSWNNRTTARKSQWLLLQHVDNYPYLNENTQRHNTDGFIFTWVWVLRWNLSDWGVVNPASQYWQKVYFSLSVSSGIELEWLRCSESNNTVSTDRRFIFTWMWVLRWNLSDWVVANPASQYWRVYFIWVWALRWKLSDWGEVNHNHSTDRRFIFTWVWVLRWNLSDWGVVNPETQ